MKFWVVAIFSFFPFFFKVIKSMNYCFKLFKMLSYKLYEQNYTIVEVA